MTPLANYTTARVPIGSLEESWRDDGFRYNLDRADVKPPIFASWIPGGTVSVCVAERVRLEERKRTVTRYRWIRGDTVAGCRRCATSQAIELVMQHRRDEDAREEAERRVRSEPARSSPLPPDIEERARRYLAKVEPSIAGSLGRNAMFHACQILMRGFALSIEQALPLAMEYDARSQPVWGQRAVLAKLRDALRRGRMEMGCLVRGKPK